MITFLGPTVVPSGPILPHIFIVYNIEYDNFASPYCGSYGPLCALYFYILCSICVFYFHVEIKNNANIMLFLTKISIMFSGTSVVEGLPPTTLALVTGAQLPPGN